MTHEAQPDDEVPGGPEHDPRLPNAAEVPVFDDPDDATFWSNHEATVRILRAGRTVDDLVVDELDEED